MRVHIISFLVLVAASVIAQPREEPAVIRAARQQDRQQLEAMIAGKQDLNTRGMYGQTALHEVAAKCDADLAELLVNAGVNRTVVDHSGRTAAMVAMYCDNGKTMHRLLGALFVPPPNVRDYQATPEARKRWTLHGAASRGDVNTLNLMLQLGHDVNAVDEQGDRALEIACRKGNARIVHVLLGHGADVHAVTSAGTTVLHEAALGGSAQVVELLIGKGAVVDATDKDTGATALHYASSFGRTEAVRALLRHGAKADAKDRRGADALQAAIANGQEETATLLRAAQAK
jgi:ankyrin repeat protein